MEQPANSSCFWLGLCLVVRYSIDFLSLVPLPSLCRYAPVLSSHSLRVGEWGREDDVYVTILTPIVHMEKAWNVRRLDVRGELSLRGSDCRMNPGFDSDVIQAFAIMYLGIWRCMCVCILVWVHYMCGFVCSAQGCLCMSYPCASEQFGSSPLMFARIFFPPFLPLVWIPVGSHVQYCSKAILIPLSALPPNILPF